MPRLPAIDPARAPDEAKTALESFFRGRGNHPNMFRTLSIRPAIMRTAAEHMRVVTEEGTVPQALKQLCVVLVSGLDISTIGAVDYFDRLNNVLEIALTK